MAERLYLIDGHSMIYRAYYAPFRELTSPAGEPTRATFIFCQQLLTFIARNKPEYLAMAVDGPVSKLKRKKLYPDYKVTRKPMPEDLLPQVERIKQIVQAMGIPVLAAEGYEADDILATAVDRFAGPELDVVMISRDKDLDQLIGPHAVLYDPMKNETLDAAGLQAAKGYPPDKAVEVQSLSGDSTDNIPGIPGVGPKKAAKLIAQYGSADEVVAHADELTPKLSQAVREHAADVALARKLVTLERKVPVELSLDRMRFAGVPGATVRRFFEELGFQRLLDQLGALAAATPGGAPNAEAVAVAKAPPASGVTTAADFRYTCVNTPEGLAELAGRLRGVKRLAVDTETTSTQAMWCELVGISLAWTPGQAVYLPVRGPLGAKFLKVEQVRQALADVLADPGVEKVGHNIKYDLIVLRNAGFEVRGELFDTMIAAHVLDATRPSYKLDSLGAELLNHRSIPIQELIGRGRKQITMDTVPVETVAIYAGEDADVTFRLAEVLAGQLAAEGLTDLLRKLEMPLLEVLVRMERSGITVEPEALKALESSLSQQADALRERIAACCGEHVNPDSPRQLAQVLFERLGLETRKKTSTGLPSTDESVLEELAAEHELPGMILEYRKLTKLLSTYLESLRKCIHPRTHRVHTSFHQAATATGRLSSSDPNLQNIPIRTQQGRQIRSAFRAAEGQMLISADYSQVELRMLAHFCQDPTLVAAFGQDQDVHRIVAAEVFGVAPDEVTPEQRARAKTVNFGIIYGQTAFGLSRTLRIPRGQAAQFIKDYRRRFPRIDEFLRECVGQAKQHGYVQTIFGRRRRIVGLDAPNAAQRSAAQRLAINSVVQGSAADLIKQAMVNIDERIRREGRPTRMLLQIHDELLFETPHADVDADREMIVREMAGAIELTVPLKVDAGVGANWMEAK
ncbi:MAG TPA: DNA polymerase I [Phycisphaerae bacterium]|nr:DNA polymerase I [Phycisphaerae bacterium]